MVSIVEQNETLDQVHESYTSSLSSSSEPLSSSEESGNGESVRKRMLGNGAPLEIDQLPTPYQYQVDRFVKNKVDFFNALIFLSFSFFLFENFNLSRMWKIIGFLISTRKRRKCISPEWLGRIEFSLGSFNKRRDILLWTSRKGLETSMANFFFFSHTTTLVMRLFPSIKKLFLKPDRRNLSNYQGSGKLEGPRSWNLKLWKQQSTPFRSPKPLLMSTIMPANFEIKRKKKRTWLCQLDLWGRKKWNEWKKREEEKRREEKRREEKRREEKRREEKILELHYSGNPSVRKINQKPRSRLWVTSGNRDWKIRAP